jgi:hypothetical protein
MGLNNLHEHGLIDFGVLCVVWDIHNAMGMTLCSTGIMGGTSQFLQYMWMTSLLRG